MRHIFLMLALLNGGFCTSLAAAPAKAEKKVPTMALVKHIATLKVLLHELHVAPFLPQDDLCHMTFRQPGFVTQVYFDKAGVPTRMNIGSTAVQLQPTDDGLTTDGLTIMVDGKAAGFIKYEERSVSMIAPDKKKVWDTISWDEQGELESWHSKQAYDAAGFLVKKQPKEQKFVNKLTSYYGSFRIGQHYWAKVIQRDPKKRPTIIDVLSFNEPKLRFEYQYCSNPEESEDETVQRLAENINALPGEHALIRSELQQYRQWSFNKKPPPPSAKDTNAMLLLRHKSKLFFIPQGPICEYTEKHKSLYFDEPFSYRFRFDPKHDYRLVEVDDGDGVQPVEYTDTHVTLSFRQYEKQHFGLHYDGFHLLNEAEGTYSLSHRFVRRRFRFGDDGFLRVSSESTGPFSIVAITRWNADKTELRVVRDHDTIERYRVKRRDARGNPLHIQLMRDERMVGQWWYEYQYCDANGLIPGKSQEGQ